MPTLKVRRLTPKGRCAIVRALKYSWKCGKHRERQLERASLDGESKRRRDLWDEKGKFIGIFAYYENRPAFQLHRSINGRTDQYDLIDSTTGVVTFTGSAHRCMDELLERRCQNNREVDIFSCNPEDFC